MTTTYTPLQLDALQELGNVGSGHAATALSRMLNTPVNIAVTQVEIFVDPADLPFQEETHTVIHRLNQDLEGFFCLVMDAADKRRICEVVGEDLSVEDPLVTEEVSQTLLTHYLHALSDMLNIKVDGEPVTMAEWKAYNVLKTSWNLDESRPLPKLALIKNSLTIQGHPMHSFINLILTEASLGRLLSALGV